MNKSSALFVDRTKENDLAKLGSFLSAYFVL